jgi:hypothetical protein
MVGVGIAGLAWLAFGGRAADRYDSSPRGARNPRRLGTGYYEVDDALGRARTERFAHRNVYGNTGRLAVDGERMANQVQRAWNDNPLLIGAAAAVFGAIVGMAVPATARENELMGETRDSVLDGVQQTVREKVDQVQQAASTVVGQVQDAVGLTAEPPTTPASSDPGRS